MITQLKPYPAYKDSGIPWLGSVPEHWNILGFENETKGVLSEITGGAT